MSYDLSFFLDLPPDIGLRARCEGDRSRGPARAQALDFQRVRDGFLTIADAEPARVVLLDARLEIRGPRAQARQANARRASRPPRTLDEIQGRDRTVVSCAARSGNGRLAHAFIFAGPAGVGKRAAAALARAVLCPEAERRLRNDASTAVWWAPEHTDLFLGTSPQRRQGARDGEHAVVEQIRRVCASLSLRPARRSGKVRIVDQAERLTAEAQNALLKTLEEAARRATLVLVTSNLDALLPTIRSRFASGCCSRRSTTRWSRRCSSAGDRSRRRSRAAALADGSLDRARSSPATRAGRAARICARVSSRSTGWYPGRLDLAGESSARAASAATQPTGARRRPCSDRSAT